MEADKQLAGEVALRFLSGPLAEKTIAVQQQVIMIGRDRQNDVVVLDPSVSRQHARIRRQRDAWTIENLSQSSFIAIDLQRTSQGVLQHNSVVNLGDTIRFIFLVQQPTVQSSPSSPPSPTRTAAEAAPPSPRNFPRDASPTSTMVAPLSE